MGHYPPKNQQEWKKLVKKLGFVDKRVGGGKHAHKYTHPTRHSKDYRIQPDFIIVPTKIYPSLSAKMIKELIFFDYSIDEIEKAAGK